jgi:ATP-dependent helicase HrpA
VQEQALAMLRRWACGRPVAPWSAAGFARVLEQARADLRGAVPRLTGLLAEIFALRQALLAHAHPYPGLAADLAALLPAGFIAATPFLQLGQLPRYLKGMKVRADRWRENPARDAERARQLAPHLRSAAALAGEGVAPEDVDRFRWLVEEYRVSLFAQELGTAEPVSAVKLGRTLRALRGPAPVAEKPAAPPLLAPKTAGPIKTLGALDRFFPRG